MRHESDESDESVTTIAIVTIVSPQVTPSVARVLTPCHTTIIFMSPIPDTYKMLSSLLRSKNVDNVSTLFCAEAEF